MNFLLGIKFMCNKPTSNIDHYHDLIQLHEANMKYKTNNRTSKIHLRACAASGQNLEQSILSSSRECPFQLLAANCEESTVDCSYWLLLQEAIAADRYPLSNDIIFSTLQRT